MIYKDFTSEAAAAGLLENQSTLPTPGPVGATGSSSTDWDHPTSMHSSHAAMMAEPVVNPLACGEVSQQACRELVERLRQVAHRLDRLASLRVQRGGDRHLLHLPLRKAGKGVEEAGHMAIKAAQIRH